MTALEAIQLIEKGVPKTKGVWADFGAGGGTFTAALASIIEPGSTIFAVDKKSKTHFSKQLNNIDIKQILADFTKPIDLPELDGIIMANALHYVKKQELILEDILKGLKTKGIFLLIEYDMYRGNPWVPYPIPKVRFWEIATKIGLSTPKLIGRHPSIYNSSDIYAAVCYKE